jgi:hypothetical protein
VSISTAETPHAEILVLFQHPFFGPHIYAIRLNVYSIFRHYQHHMFII